MEIPGDRTGCPKPRGTTTTPAGERRWLPCGRLGCGYCGAVAGLRTVSAIILTKPERAGFLSLRPGQVATAESLAAGPLLLRTAMGRMAAEFERRGLTWEHASIVELSASGRPHLHFLQWGDPVASAVLRKAAREHGVGWTEMAPIRRLPVIAKYVLKVPISALDLPPAEAAEVMAAHKLLNGGRLITSTRGFWRDETGDPLVGVRAARSAAYRSWKRGLRPQASPRRT